VTGRDHAHFLLTPILLMAVLMAVHGAVMYSAGLELHYEESQYWLWSTRPDWSYYSKGPLVAWLIAVATAVLGDGEVQVRLFAWAAHGLFLAAVYGFALDLWGRRDAARWALILAGLMPVYFLLGGVMTTDVFLFLAWTLALWAAYRALVRERPAAWYLMGVAVGLGALGKLSIGLLPVAVGLAMLTRPQWRRQFLTMQPWIAALIALLLMAPVIGWNAANHWVMFRHDEGHVMGGGATGGELIEFFAGQVFALSPLVAVTLLLTLWRPSGEPGPRLLWLVSLGVLAFFVVKAVAGKVQPNWPAAAYIGLVVLLAGEAVRRGPGFRTWLGGAVVVAVLQILAMLYLPLAGAFGDRDPLNDLRGWRGPIEDMARQTGDADFLLTRNYRLASRLAFYWPGDLPVYIGGDPDRRFNQFDLWPGPEGYEGGTALYVVDEDALPATIQGAFAGCSPIPRRGAERSVLFGWHCRGFKGVTWAPPGRY
jgi:undecaprenyl-diphosphatase